MLFEENVERIAKAWFEKPCEGWEEGFCNRDLHVWENAHPEDKEHARRMIRFTLHEMGFRS